MFPKEESVLTRATEEGENIEFRFLIVIEESRCYVAKSATVSDGLIFSFYRNIPSRNHAIPSVSFRVLLLMLLLA